MTQNMFQEGLYQVFFKETPSAPPLNQVTRNGELINGRLHRWFGTVINTRLLVTGVVQILSALACILATITHACVGYNCSVSMTTPVWSSLSYLAAGSLAMEVQRKANKLKPPVWLLCYPGQQHQDCTAGRTQNQPTACGFLCCKGELHCVHRSVLSGVALHSFPVVARPASLQSSAVSGLQPPRTGCR
ncbi:transmembrane protein 253 isoform 2-T2 [Spinachia spinachia]